MSKRIKYWFGIGVLLFGIGFIYLKYQAITIYGGDAGDLVSAIATLGIPHPPGYPLYTILGILVSSLVQFGTLAWKVGFLSSFFGLLTVIILFDTLYYIFGRLLYSLIISLVFSFLYPIWLYSSVVEVFALNNFFTVILIWSGIHFYLEKKLKYFYVLTFFFGLSLTHHHIIIFLLPGIIYLLVRNKGMLSAKMAVKGFLLLILGLLPYLYVFYSSAGNPAVNWQGYPTIQHFWQLVTRAGYGTFRAGAFIAHHPLLRIVDVAAFFNFLYQDFRVLGMILILMGALYLFINKRTLLVYFGLIILSYLFFIFYASFPLIDNFLIGTFERFIQPLYIITSFFLVGGMILLENTIKIFLKKYFSPKKIRVILLLVTFMFFIYPVSIFFLNYPKISILRNDLTAENLGGDILTSIPDDSILIISTDTPLFNTQYVYYSQQKWPKVKLIHLAKMYLPYYYDQLRKFYPDLIFPDKGDSPKSQFQSFLDNNYHKYPIFSKLSFATDNGVFVPWGLLFRFYKKEDVPKDEQILQSNEKLWKKYHNPLDGSLSKYKNLLLSDVLRIYALSRQEIAFWEAKRGYLEEAATHLIEAEKLFPEDLDSYTILAQVYLLQKKCLQAQEQIEARLDREKDDPGSYFLQSLNYAVCFKDKEKASFYEKLYEEKKQGKETNLKQL